MEKKSKSTSGRKGSDTTSEEAAGAAFSQQDIDEKRVQDRVSTVPS